MNKPTPTSNNHNQVALASKELLNITVEALKSKNIHPIVVNNGSEALEEIKKIIPPDKSVMNGASVTLKQIGFVDLLKSDHHPWNNLHEKILAEKDPDKQADLRKNSILSDFYLGSVHALIKNGEFIIASNTGSQLPHIVYTSANLIFVVSTKKIVNTYDEAIKRLENVVIPLEDERMRGIYGFGTSLNKLLIFKNENPMMKRNVYMILVEEDLGF